MRPVYIAGVDPGLVHTGVVEFYFHPDIRLWWTRATIVDGLNVDEVALVLKNRFHKVFIEAYKPRSHFQNDAKMGEAITLMRKRIPNAQTLVNTGVKQQVKPDLMKALGVWRFRQTTHHQDLRSAARIALYGMMKEEHWNKLLSDFIRDHIDGKPWIEQL